MRPNGEGLDLDQEIEVESIVEKLLREHLDAVQQQTEANERLLAELLMGYQELTVVVQTLLAKLYGTSEEDTEDFKRRLDTERKRMMEWIRNGAAAMAVSEEDLAATLEQLLPSQSRNTD